MDIVPILIDLKLALTTGCDYHDFQIDDFIILKLPIPSYNAHFSQSF